MIGKLVFREYRPEDAESFVALHDSVFSRVPIRPEFWAAWSRRPDVTAAVAVYGDRMVGTVPFHLRSFLLRPKLSVRAAFEYSVGVAEEHRRHGIGSRLMDCAKQFLRGHADVMMVYRGNESSDGYRFYAKNGHSDVAYLREWSLENPTGGMAGCRRLASREDFIGLNRQALPLFRRCYRRFGGHQVRSSEFYADALSSLIFEEVKQDFVFLTIFKGETLRGYMIVGHRKDMGHMQVLELATEGGAKPPAHRLVEAACAVASQAGCRLSVRCRERGPFADVYRAAGFRPAPRERACMMIMAYPLDIDALARKVFSPQRGLENVQIRLWSPSHSGILQPAAKTPRRTIVLEMKDDMLTRLLLSRLDLRHAVQMELVTAHGASEEDIDLIARGVPFCEWEHHGIDYI